MPRRLKRLLVPVLALIALVVLFPALTTAAPHQGEAVRAPAERHEAAPSLFAQLRSLLSLLWKTGSGLDPNGTQPGAPNATTSGDTGSGLDPDGRP
jgi:hypothetical protein